MPGLERGTRTYAAAVRSQMEFRNRRRGYVSDAEAHVAFNKAFTRQLLAETTKHKRVISTARLTRGGGKSWEFLNGGDNSLVAEKVWKYPSGKVLTRQQLLNEEAWIIFNDKHR